MVTRNEIRAGGALVGDALGGGVRAIRHVHAAIADRVFEALTPGASPVRLVHDAVTAATYGTVQVAHLATPRIGAMAAAAFSTDQGSAGGSRPAARLALGTLNGLWGDRVERRYSALATPMALRSDGADVALTSTDVARTYPQATKRVAVFVHGLCEHERSWWHRAERHHGDPAVSYGTLLRDEHGFTPVYLRYNTGRCIADNARSLSDLLEELVELWPVPVEEMVLIGHSMGGLVIRGACHTGAEAGRSWPAPVRHVFCLGTPHLGARLEQGVEALAVALGRLPETRPAAGFLDTRSAGVKDLRHGACVADDAHGHDPGRFVRRRREEVPFLEHASYYFIAATVTRDPGHPAAAWVGDLIVHPPSASGRDRDRQVPFPAENGAHLGGMNHLDLLNHPAVYAQLAAWVGGAADQRVGWSGGGFERLGFSVLSATPRTPPSGAGG